MKNNLFPLWLSPVLMGAGSLLVYASNITISYTPPNASLNTLLTGELVVPSQMPIPGAEPLKLLGLGSLGLGLARLGGYAFGKKSDSSDMAQLPPWQQPRLVTPISYVTEPMKDARVPDEVEEPLAPTPNSTQSLETAIIPPPPPESVAVAEPTPPIPQPLPEPPLLSAAAVSAPETTPPPAAATEPVTILPESPIPQNPPQTAAIEPVTILPQPPIPQTPPQTAATEPVTVLPQPPIPQTPPQTAAIEPVTVLPQPPIPESHEPNPIVPTGTEAVAPTEEPKVEPIPPTVPSDTSGQSVNPLGVVHRIVEAVTHPSMPQHIAIAGIPRGGKSYTLRGIIWGIKQIEPEATLYIVDPKNSPMGWLGLEKIPGCVRFAHHGLKSALETIDEAIALLERAIDTRDTHQNAYFIFDDWSSLLAEAKQLDAKLTATEPQASKIYPDLLYNMERLALKGLEYGIHLILATHSWDCVEFGFDTRCRSAFAIAALGRQGRWETLSSLLKSEVSIPDDDARERLAQQKSEAIEKVRDRECPIVLLAGDSGILDAVPDLEWLDWVDLSVFADKPAAEPDTGHLNGNASKPMAEIA